PEMVDFDRQLQKLRDEYKKVVNQKFRSDWERLDLSKPANHHDLIDEMMNSEKIIGFGKSLHCYLVPKRTLVEVYCSEQIARKVPEGLLAKRKNEQEKMLVDLHNKCSSSYRFKNYRALGVASSLMEAVLKQDDVSDLIRKLKDDRTRGTLGFL